ncbi:NEDD8-activating enzyme E1 catalytic subunit-like [Clytia hemisphaerica]|uniref:NEDD8-activating enzyme E1 catalytic subunit n=2 Tax=Clytia hemisphaerica TaxID=252671 RepID=A0A7M5WQE1_9CNID
MEVENNVSSHITAKFGHISKFLNTNGPMQHPEFEAAPILLDFIRENVNILVIGAGGLGCELLKDLALSGFHNISVIDMDTIDLSNLNRQFLFRAKDIGKPKAEVAAAFINKRIPSCNVTPYYNKIQDFDDDFYRNFQVIVCGLDSVVARRWMNGMVHTLLNYEEDGSITPGTLIPIVDGGTEGFKGNARVIYPGRTACIECNLDLYPKQVNFPLCTLAETPRLPEHCIEYIKIVVWPKEFPFGGGVNIDGDNPDHIAWICQRASERAQQYGIEGVNYRLTQGVIKNIIPAVASTNAVIAAMCVTEVFKAITCCYKTMENYTVFNDSQGVYTYTFEAEKKEDCPVCSRKPIERKVEFTSTLGEVIEQLKNEFELKNPGVTTLFGDKTKTLYVPNIPSLEASTRPNLSKTLTDLGFQPGQALNITDSALPKTLEIQLLS